MLADLHLHTFFSDGTFSPEELTARGQAAGLGCLALTDHDTVEGCPRMHAACAQAGVEFIPGAELTTEWQGFEVHILGYFLDVEHPELLALLRQLPQAKIVVTHDMQFARAIASRAVFFEKGKIAAAGSVDELVSRFHWRSE